MLVTIDFEKAFDSLDYTYLVQVLQAFIFGFSILTYQVVLLTMVSHQIIIQLVGAFDKVTQYPLFYFY